MNRIPNTVLILSLFIGVFANDKYCEDYSWIKFEDNCYSFEKERLSFYDAEDLCRSKGAHLVSIHSTSENEFLTRMHSERYGGRRWIGLTVYDNSGNLKWSDDTDVDYKKIASKTQYTKEKCYIFFMDQGWRPDHCELRNYPLCKKSVKDVTPSPIPPITTVVPEGNCPNDWLQFNQKCYKFYDEQLYYKKAKESCLALGVEFDLVSIHSAEEQAFLVQQLGNFGSSAWIGLNHIESDEIGHISVFGWTDNSRVDFKNWAPGHPKPGTWKYCVRLSYEGLSKGQWLSDYCSTGTGKYGYICSRDPVPNLPTQAPTLSPCSEGYKGYQNSCYRFYSNPETWEIAEKTCQDENGHLVSITDSFQEAFLYSLVNGQASLYWNGLKTIEKTLILQWSDKQPLYYSKWSENQPRISDDINSSCTSMTSDTLEWTVASCEKKLPFVCMTTTDIPPSVPLAIIGKCQARETQLFDIGDEYCYHTGTNKDYKLPWGNLHRYCLTRGIEMITINSIHQNKLLMAYAGREPYDYWLGLIRSFDRESFIWIDDSPLNYTNWEEREPSTWSSDKDCVGFSSENSKWSVKECSSWLGTICRSKKVIQ